MKRFLPFLLVGPVVLLLASADLMAAEIPIAGSVVADGQPLAGAEVHLLPWSEQIDPRWLDPSGKGPRPTAVTVSSVTGRFRLTAPSAGWWRVRLSAPGRQGREMSLGPLVEPARLPEVELRAVREIDVRVRRAGGEPVAGAILVWPATRTEGSAAGGAWLPAPSIAVTDAGGSGRLTVEPGGPPELLAMAPGLLPARASWQVVEPGDKVRIGLEPGSRRALRVLDAEGRAVPGAEIYAPDEGLPRAETDARGRALVALPAVDQPMALRAISGQGRGVVEVLPARPGDGGEVVDLMLAPVRQVRGRVIDRASSKPVAEALVWNEPADGTSTVSDGEGVFLLAVSGDPSLAVAVRGRGTTATRGSALTRCDEQAQSGAAVRPARRGNLVGDRRQPSERLCYQPLATGRGRVGVGRVVDQDEEPVAGAEVRWTAALHQAGSVAESILVVSNREGRFEIPEPVPGTYDLEVRAAGFGPLHVPGLEIGEGTGEVDLGTVMLLPGARLEGWVVDAGGRGLDGVRVSVAGPGEAAAEVEYLMSGPIAVVTSDEQGFFAVPDLTPGDEIYVRVEKEGFDPEIFESLQVPTLEPLEVVLRAGATVTGRVTDRRGRAVPDALVTVTPEDGGAPGGSAGLTSAGRSAIGSEDGWFEVRGVRPGALVIDATAPGFRDLRLTGLEVEAGQVLADVEVVLERGARIAGTVRDAAGSPVADVTVSVSAAVAEAEDGDATGTLTRTGPAGDYELAGLAAGRLQVVAEDERGRRAERTVDLGPEADLRPLDLTLEGGVELSGWILNEQDGAPVAGAAVLLIDSTGRRQAVQARTDAGGRFLFDDVSPGFYYFLARGEGFAPFSSGDPFEVESYPLTDIEVFLRRGHTVRGQILGVAFEDLPRVSVRAPIAGGGAAVTVDYEGRFILSDLPAGEVVLEASISGTGLTVRRGFSLPGTPEVVLDFGLSAADRRGKRPDG